jgi:hypothetical protein
MYIEYANRHTPEYRDVAWDGVDYVDLEVDDDWIQKALAIKEDRDYDHKVTVPLELSDDEIFRLMKMAHERDITLNQFVEELLWEAINREKTKA